MTHIMFNLDICKKYAFDHNGECLETEYKHNRFYMRWKCHEGHIWKERCARLIKGNKWCKICNPEKTYFTLDDLHEYAHIREGECLETKYTGRTMLSRFRCKLKHIWVVKWINMYRDSTWCPHCSGKYNNSLELCKDIAASHGGELLSTEYKNEKSDLTWKCENEHIFETNLDNVKNAGHWCYICGGTNRLTIEDCRQTAKENGGECLETEYKNDRILMRWKCHEGHIWKARYSNVRRRKSWCPQCYDSGHRSENLTIQYASRFLDSKFIKTHPEWLRYKSNKCLELDGYNEEYKVAIEYQGIQHYKFMPMWHDTLNDFIDQQERDAFKREKCKEYDIILIEVPYKYSFVKEQELFDFLDSQLMKVIIKRVYSVTMKDFYICQDLVMCSTCGCQYDVFNDEIYELLDNYPKICVNSICSNYRDL